jgi:Putative Ig domain
MHKLLSAARRRRTGIAAGAVLAAGLAGAVLLTSGTAYAATTNTAAQTVRLDSADSSGAPVFTADNPPLDATGGQSYSYTFQASGSSVRYSLGAGAPSWLHINPATGTVSGTAPASGGSFSYYVIAQNGYGSATSSRFTVNFGKPGNDRADVTTYLSCTSTVSAGGKGTCTLYVTNRGNSARDVTAQIALPSQLRLDGSGDYDSYRTSGNTASVNLGMLRPGQTREMTVTFTAKTGLALWGWHHGQRFQVKVTGSVTSDGGFSYYGQQDSTATVTIVPRGWWA